ncbi:MAG: hydrophobe/amphiphile efflux-1 family RND transporter [Flavobacteriaceae bacterium CG_4_8_14_3_um_filter_34_10]|nr:efflux RND transporter permease subunit [Flavobacteriia bacterium]OIP48986.1 MAG: multidrug transporter AcrB [Flavobacteriaceae bacterium CG2_30_34_30]PIQ18490.1 MAG: hydrophobe/amphiphile efflux-1 family RND transporter [Flavobacteriaceae bacterium CG18_big_fil_WC_8_21_14_2_50_34_36]PIV51171.1 MAG: hydrophobe/amphiphile efflux-1 family RND transporter [Flavobacteriaceae bacterium CG02_land_8_20_14_3_00_34_13]PIX10020.1 MAG: hydrophobe/amphiphile efflux-1 family RND transporter [Flavobacteri
MIKLFIERPVLSTVVSIIIVLLGILGINALPTTQYPEIAPPTIQVNANFPGANAQTVLESVVIPIEEQINGVEGMTYITSTASNNGSAQIQVFFEQGVDPDIAAINVQNRVARANPLLPREVTQSGVITQKQQTSALMFLTVFSENKDYNATYIQNYLNINVLPALKRINGVGNVNVFGSKNYAMRIWLQPEKLAAYHLVPEDITAAINEQSREAAAGSLGQNNAEAFEYVLTYSGRYKEESQYENIVIKALDGGQFLYLKDVATVELDAEAYSVISFTNGNPGVSMGIYQTPGSNAQEIIENVHETMKGLAAGFPKGLTYIVNFDTNEFLTASINKVLVTLLEAFLLVFLVVFLFLQDFRSTLIPAIAVPVSIIGTFFFLNLFGYSINLLTLFALLLAIGIVVDDAIVVVEAVHAKLEKGVTSALEASKQAMDEITGAIISITLVMGAVFIPVTFIEGPTGVFYKQFGVTLIVAIGISAINALTLSPALSALFLKPHTDKERKKNLMGRFFLGFNKVFTASTKKYITSLHFLYRHKWVTVLILVVSVAGIFWASSETPKGFVPDEDRGLIFVNVELPAGATLDRTVQITAEISEKARKIPGIRAISLVNGFSIIGGSGSNFGLGFIKLDSWEERKDPSKSVEAITGQLFGMAAGIPGAKILFFAPPSVPGFGISSGFELKVLDPFGGSFSDLNEVTQNYLQELNARPEILYAQSSFNTNYAQYEIDVNIAKTKEAGITVSSILSALQGYIGSVYAADFSRFGKQYRVFVQALPEDRTSVESLNRLFVRNAQGEMAPITAFIELKRVYGPQSVTRFNLFNSASINGAAAPGYSTGDAIAAVQEVTATALPQDYSVGFSGLTREEISSGNQTTTIFLLSILFVYFILAAQYESYLLPLAVIFSLPVGVMGAYMVTMLSGLENNIYFQIALIMLLGLLAKNAILIVEFARQRRRAGYSISEAAFEGAKARLRPILMTSFAFIIGLLPLVFASGIGARGNNAIGTGAVGGLFVGTVLGIFIIPILYIFFQWLQEKVSKKAPIIVTNESHE